MTNEEKLAVKWDSLTIKDNFIFGKVMEVNSDWCRRLIEHILDIKIESISYPEREKTIEARLDSKGIRLDVYVKDDKNRSFDIEIQLTDNDDLAKRMRYYIGLIDLDKLNKGKSVKYKSLGESYIIFICTFDVFGYGYQLYDFDIVCRRNSALHLIDGTHRIFLCTEGEDEELKEEVKNFLDYVAGRGIKSDFIQELDETAKRVKLSKEWRLSYMTYELALLEREEQGREESTIEHLRSVINSLKVPVERAMEILNVPKDEQSYYAFKLKESVK